MFWKLSGNRPALLCCYSLGVATIVTIANGRVPSKLSYYLQFKKKTCLRWKTKPTVITINIILRLWNSHSFLMHTRFSIAGFLAIIRRLNRIWCIAPETDNHHTGTGQIHLSRKHKMGAATILAFDKYLRGTLRPTTARRLSAYMSSRALATYTTYSFF